jgi:hypothetical protein
MAGQSWARNLRPVLVLGADGRGPTRRPEVTRRELADYADFEPERCRKTAFSQVM